MKRPKIKELDPEQTSRLCRAIQRSRLMLRRYRENRREMVRQFVGYHWSEEGSQERVPVNLISLYVSVVGRNLIAKNPRVMLSTFDRSMKPTVSAMQTWANKEIERKKLQETLQRVVTDALFSIGICKVALATPAESASMAWSLGAGQPFAESVDLDDFVFDIGAQSFEEVTYIGHRYRVPLDVVKDSKIYGPARKQLEANDPQLYNQEGDERIGVLGKGIYAGNMEEFEDHVDLWEIYLPRHRLVLTLADEWIAGPGGNSGAIGDDKALRTQRWLGPDSGPYKILAMSVVPGNAMPKAPIQDLMDLHLSANRTYRKMSRTVDRIKEILMVSSGAMEDAQRITNADDGDGVQVNNPERVKPAVMSGNTYQLLTASSTVWKDLFVYMAGNLDMMGGLSPQSKTLGQDQMLQQNASRAIADMQDRTVSFTADVLKSLCWYWWHDPFLVQKSLHHLPGLPELQLQRQVTPKQRQQGRFEDLEIQVDPYSMQHQTPQTRMAAINQVVTQIILPMMQIMVSQGVSFDVSSYLQKVSQYMDMPDLAEIITIAEPPQQDSQPAGQGGRTPGPMKPAQTERQYTRNNVSSQTRESSDRNLVASMLGHNLGGNHNTNGATSS